MDKYNGIIISLIAGISTILGFFFIYVKGNKNKIISSSLSFASGVMITLSIIDLIPSSVRNLSIKNGLTISIIMTIIAFTIGFLISYVVQNLVKEKEGLYKTGLISMIGIIVHNIPEGIATYVLSSIDLKLGIMLAITIIMHNIPEGIGISIPIYYSTKNKKKAFIYTAVSGLSEPLGAFLSMIFLNKYINASTIGLLYGIIAGLMVYIGYFEMIKESKKHNKNIHNFTLLGALFILIVEILLKM